MRRRRLVRRSARRFRRDPETIASSRRIINSYMNWKDSSGSSNYAPHKAVPHMQVLADLLIEKGDNQLAYEISNLSRRIRDGYTYQLSEWTRLNKRLEKIDTKGVRKTKEYSLPNLFTEERKLGTAGTKFRSYGLTSYEAHYLLKFNGIDKPKRGWEYEIKKIPGHEGGSERFFITKEWHPREKVPERFNPGKDGQVWALRRYPEGRGFG